MVDAQFLIFDQFKVYGHVLQKIDDKPVLQITTLDCGFNYMDWTDGLDYCINN